MNKLLLAAVVVCALSAGQHAMASEGKEGQVKIDQPGWRAPVKNSLEKIVRQGAGQNKTVVFDFDNTLICRDIGEGAFAVLVKEKTVTKSSIPSELRLEFSLPADGSIISMDKVADPTEYYEKLLSALPESPYDKSPHTTGYAWIAQAMAGLSPGQVVAATQKAFAGNSAQKDLGRPGSEDKIEVSPGKTSYRRPFFYPQMVELVGLFTASGYDVWVVSASNVWTVRWMVTEGLNKQLARIGRPGVPPENVIGVSLIIRRKSDGLLQKDRVLVRENKAYAASDPEELARYELTSLIVHPLPSYWGKAANVMEHIGKKPYLVAGDSPNDHAMLAMAEHKLWLARLEKPGYQKATTEASDPSWMVQPTLYKKSVGFVAGSKDLESRLSPLPEPVAQSVDILRQAGLLEGF